MYKDYTKNKRKWLIWKVRLEHNKFKILFVCLITIGLMFLANFLSVRFYEKQLVYQKEISDIRIITGDIVVDVLSGTPMGDAIESIKKASDYFDVPEELFLGLANAESTFKNFKCHNPWGIKVGKRIKCFESWEESVNEFASLIKYHYLNKGLDTPEEIYKRYVNDDCEYWIDNVKKYYSPD